MTGARRPIGLLAAMLVLCALCWQPAPARATYAAAFANQSAPAGSLEPGDTVPLWFEFRNTGDQTWYRDGAVPVRLGTSNPRDSANPFFDPADWVQSTRPTGLDQASVSPGGVGRFSFRVKAPSQLMSNQVFSFAPLAEGVVWMIPEGQQVWLPFTVIPAEPPAVRITGAPARVRRGDGFTVSVQASDNRSVADVTFAVGAVSQTVTGAAGSPGTYTATLPSDGLAEGTQTVTVTASDPGGRKTSATTSFEVYATPPPATTPATPRPTSSTPRAFKATFSTRARLGHGRILGRVRGVQLVTGAPRGSRVTVRCVRGCVRSLRRSRRWRGTSTVMALGLSVTRRTVLSVKVRRPDGGVRSQRYRFYKRAGALLAHRMAA